MNLKTYIRIGLTCSTIFTAEATSLPFFEGFESADGVMNGSIHGQNGWTKTGATADVQSVIAQSGLQALDIQNAHVMHDLSNSNSAIWLNFQARCAAAPTSNPSLLERNTTLSFFISTNLNLVVYSNEIPVELSAQIQLNTWTRFDIYCDYDNQYWDLSMDGINVVAGLPLYSTNTVLDSVVIANESNSSVYFDQIDIADTEQTSSSLPDSDSDEIPDWWEQKYFGGIIAVVAGNSSGNRDLTYLQTYIAGVSPFIDEPFVVSPISSGNGFGWNSVPSRMYSVYSTTNLVVGFALLQDGLLYPQNEFIDPGNSGDAARFYRLTVQVE